MHAHIVDVYEHIEVQIQAWACVCIYIYRVCVHPDSSAGHAVELQAAGSIQSCALDVASE